MLSLTIISHTPHYYGNDGAIVGLEPTVREINYLSQLFETIYHVAPLHSSDPHNATSSYISKNIIYPKGIHAISRLVRPGYEERVPPNTAVD